MTEWTPEDLEAAKRRNPDFAAVNPGLGRAVGTTQPQTVNGANENEAKIAGHRRAAKPKRKQPEKELEQFVHDTAKACGLLYYHTYRSRFSEPGYPDCLILGRYLLIAELKDTGKYPTASQQHWLENFARVGIPARVWRPEDRDEIIETLQDMRTSK